MEAKHIEEIREIKQELARLDMLNREVTERVRQGATPAIDDEGNSLNYEALIAKTAVIAASICNDYQNTSPVCISLLDGALPFASKLQEFLSEEERNFEFVYTTMQVKSYDFHRSGELNIISPPKVSVAGKHVIVIDDVWDTGATFAGVKEYLENELGAESVDLAVLVNKEQEREVASPRWLYSCFTLPEDAFIIGFGLDYSGRCRNMRDIKVVDPRTLPTAVEEQEIAQIKVLDKRLQTLLADIKRQRQASIEDRRSPLRDFTVFEGGRDSQAKNLSSQPQIDTTIEGGRSDHTL